MCRRDLKTPVLRISDSLDTYDSANMLQACCGNNGPSLVTDFSSR